MELLQNAVQSDPEISSISWQKSVHSPLRQWGGKNARVKVRNVCRSCNNGWMSGLEANSGPILSPMILGQSASLDALKQLTIATWAVKTAMIFDAMRHGDEVFYTTEDRRHLCKQLTAPTCTFGIWLGGYAGAGFAAYTDGRTLRGSTKHALSGRPMKCHVQTMAFGGLVLQVLSLTTDTSQFSEIKVDACRGLWDDHGTLQIWPVIDVDGTVDWPPARVFNDADCTLEAFADRFNRAHCGQGTLTLRRGG